MKVRAAERQFNIFELFIHDHEATEVRPFCQWTLQQRLNELAEAQFPDSYVFFTCPDDNGLSQWNVHFNKDRYDYDSQPGVKFRTYPQPRVHSVKDFLKLIPRELETILRALENVEIEL